MNENKIEFKNGILKLYSVIINMNKVNSVFIGCHEISEKTTWVLVFEFENKTTTKHIFESEQRCKEVIEEIFLRI